MRRGLNAYRDPARENKAIIESNTCKYKMTFEKQYIVIQNFYFQNKYFKTQGRPVSSLHR